MRLSTMLAIVLTGATLRGVSPAKAQTGTVTGTVELAGPAPAVRWLTVTKNTEVCGDSVQARDLVVKAGKVADAVVLVDGVTGAPAPAPRQHKLSNAHCVFDPPVLAVGVGDSLLVDNQDDVLHNTHLNLRYGARVRTVANWGLSQKGMSVRSDRVFRQAGHIEVQCDAHPWMAATIYVIPHRLFALSDAAGRFTISDVPAGTRTVKLLHPVLGELEQSVTVPAGGSVSVTFKAPAPKLAERGGR